jgi:hypothetical protein
MPAFNWKAPLISVNPEGTVTVALFNSGSRKPIGSLELQMKDLQGGGVVEDWLPLTHDGKPAGALHLRRHLVSKDPSSSGAVVVKLPVRFRSVA